MRKGFLHVVEVLIVIMLVFTVLSQFYTIPRSEQAWSTTKLTIMAQDLLYTLEETNIDWFDAAAVSGALAVLPETMDYALTTEQAIRPKMKILCACSVAQHTSLENDVLQPAGTSFVINGITRTYERIDRVEPVGMDFSLDAITQYDVIIFWGFPVINGQEANNLSEYLRQGNGVVLFSNLTEAQVGESWHMNVFNLEWESAMRPSSTADFHYFEPADKGYTVKKIFNLSTPGFAGFSDFGDESVYPADESESRIIAELDDTYSGTEKHVPLAVINWAVNGKGRSAWMSNATLSDADNANLLKSLIMWAASGKEFKVIEGTMVESAKASIRKVYNSDMYEPVKIELTIGYHF